MAKKINTDDSSLKVNQRSKLIGKLKFKELYDFSERQREVIATLVNKDTSVVFIDGPAGSSKTFLSVLAALKLIDCKRVSHVMYVRSLAESASKSIGALPGEMYEKYAPFLMPLNDKIAEIIEGHSRALLHDQKRIEAMPINFLRGASINAACVIVDEAQNLDMKELTTAITRIGEFSKFFFVGDSRQSDINGKSGFKKMYELFDDDESKSQGIHCFKFTNEDIVRSGILRYIAEKIEEGTKLI